MFKLYTAKNNHRYEIHDNGDIYSCERKTTGACKGTVKRHKLKQFNITGYCAVNFGASERNVLVHRLVASMFIDNADNKPQVNHIDGNKTNNCVSNLEWCTREENMAHSHNVLKQKLTTKLKSDDRVKIIERFNRGESMVKINKDYDVSYNTIRRIVTGAEYKCKTNNCNYYQSNKKRKTAGDRAPNEIKSKILQELKDGKSYGYIAQKYHVSKFTVAQCNGWARKK